LLLGAFAYNRIYPTVEALASVGIYITLRKNQAVRFHFRRRMKNYKRGGFLVS
jgi:hypothetical protein